MSKITEQPVPQGTYLSAIRHNEMVYTSGMTPRKAGKLIFSGQIRASDPVESHKEAIQLATLNAITAAESCLREGERIALILQLNVFLNAEKEFTAHTKMANYATDVLVEKLGTNGIGSRAAIGVASLPSNAPVEITLTATIA